MTWSMSTRPDHSLGKEIKLYKMKNKKNTWVFVFQKYGKFWSMSLDHFIKHKTLISEEWNRYHYQGMYDVSMYVPVIGMPQNPCVALKSTRSCTVCVGLNTHGSTMRPCWYFLTFLTSLAFNVNNFGFIVIVL